MSRAFFFSLCAHGVLAGFFVFTLGASVPRPAQQLLFSGELFSSGIVSALPGSPAVEVPVRVPQGEAAPAVTGYQWAKPSVAVSALAEKPPAIFAPAASSKPVLKEPVLFLHPQLPAQLDLYFKDRQEVHIELFFSINPAQEKGGIEVKRRISSGNLQADLLSRRYISHYLFIQRGRFAPDEWHPVKVDLSVSAHDAH